MLTRYDQSPQQQFLITRCLMASAMLVWLLASVMLPAYAQGSFNSGSTGADGAFSPTQHQNVQVPPSGVFNYTTFNIPAGVYITYIPNANNTPVTILTTGNVTIAGRIYITGRDGYYSRGGAGGPGGFRGGDGGAFFDNPEGRSGDGSGGGGGGRGAANLSSTGGGGGGGFLTPGGNGGGTNGGQGGPRYGTRTLLPLIGGSGGGGGSAADNGFGGGAGGGGGAILIASSGNITFTGNDAYTFAHGGLGAGNIGGNGGGGGSGGAIRLVANVISGSPYLQVQGRGSCCGNGAGGSHGYVRAEAFDLNGFDPNLTAASISYGLPNPVTLPNSPLLKIVSVGGVNAPTNPKGSFYQQPDIVVPTTTANPVAVALEANNLPVGTVLQVTLTQETGQRTSVNSTPLAGTQATSTATASVTLPATGIAVIGATVTLNVLIAYGRPMFIEGERVDKVEIAATFGGESQVTYITASGKRLKWPR